MFEKVKEPQVRIGDLIIVIVDHLTLKDELRKKLAGIKTAEGVKQDIKETTQVRPKNMTFTMRII